MSAEHVDRIAELAKQIGVEAVAPADQILADAAATVNVAELKQLCQRIRDFVDPDGPEPMEAFERRELTISKLRGMIMLRGQLDPEGGAAVQEALDALMRPPAPDDLRTPGQRRADALVDLARRALAHGDLPTVGGMRPQVGILLSPSTLLYGEDGTDPHTRMHAPFDDDTDAPDIGHHFDRDGDGDGDGDGHHGESGGEGTSEAAEAGQRSDRAHAANADQRSDPAHADTADGPAVRPGTRRHRRRTRAIRVRRPPTAVRQPAAVRPPDREAIRPRRPIRWPRSGFRHRSTRGSTGTGPSHPPLAKAHRLRLGPLADRPGPGHRPTPRCRPRAPARTVVDPPGAVRPRPRMPMARLHHPGGVDRRAPPQRVARRAPHTHR